ncbi:MAG: transposase [Burkholderiales bacterium]|nr:transposase [Burkholderiales bacterium]
MSANASVLPTPGARYGLNGELYEVTRTDDGFVHFRAVHMQRERVVAATDFAKQLKNGTLVLKVKAPIEISVAPLTLNMPACVRDEYERRLAYVQRFYREFRGSLPRREFARIAKMVAASIKDEHPPAYDTVYVWHRRFLQAGGNPLALAPVAARQQTRARKLPEEAINAIARYIKEEYLTKERPSAQAVYDLLKAELDANNKSRAPDQQQLIPSRQTFFRAVWDLDPHVVDMLRYGHKTARKHHRYGKAIHPSTRIGERVEADSHLLDVLVVDRLGKIIGRPYLCALMDVCTRCIIGWEISFTPPCGAKVLRALRLAMSDASGRPYACAPEELVLDNGSEFQNVTLQTVAGTYGITLRYVQPASPNEKPHIERFFGTVNTQLVHMMPGTTRSNPTDRGEYDSEGQATLTLEEVRDRFAFWLDQVHHFSPHAELSLPPSEMWRVASEAIAPTTCPETDLALNCRSVVLRAISGGRVSFANLDWTGPSLPDVARRLAARGGDKTHVYHDETDLGVVWVQDPDDRALLYQAHAVHPEYQNGLSLFEHRLLQQQLRQQKERFTTYDLLQAKAVLYRQLRADTKTARKQRARVESPAQTLLLANPNGVASPEDMTTHVTSDVPSRLASNMTGTIVSKARRTRTRAKPKTLPPTNESSPDNDFDSNASPVKMSAEPSALNAIDGPEDLDGFVLQ